MEPSLVFQDRPSDSPFIERVWGSRSARAGTFQSIAACHWEMVVVRHQGRTSLIVRGPETRATMAEFPAHGDWFAIRFKLGTFMPLLRPGMLRDRNDVVLPDAASRSFWLNGSAWDYPTFGNAETFVKRLAEAGLVVEDRLVGDALRGRGGPAGSRTEQRRFIRVTGLTRGAIRQIERARCATLLLRQGVPILDAGFEAGYYDQAHFTRSLKRWIGQTPAQVVRADRQLSFLYKTDFPGSAMFRASHS